jgi:hypothetical protein
MASFWSGNRKPGLAFAASVGVLGLALGGCSSNAVPGMSSLSGMFGSSRADTAQASAQAGPPPSFECPSVAVRQGAATMQISANPSDPTPLNMRYQLGIGETARECKLVGTTVSMRVGIHGRVILGPAGGAGQIDVPVRLAVVREGPDPRPVATRLHRVNVAVPQNDTNVSFTTIEEDLSFPMPPGGDIDSYVVYVGFDPLAVREAPRRPERRPPARSNRQS